MIEIQNKCKYCNTVGPGSFCSSCGQSFHPARLTLKSLVFEAFHFFTHLDHGFPYTLKRLLIAPGTMQREYIDGYRAKYQKPFSMFFLCATIAALTLYWVSLLLASYPVPTVPAFFNKYWVILQTLLLPLVALITYLLFYRSKLNYGEILIFHLYLLSFLFIQISMIQPLRFIFPNLNTRYIELPVMMFYSLLTHVNFFTTYKKWVVICITMIAGVGVYFLATYFQDTLSKIFS